MYPEITLHKRLRLARGYKRAVLDELMGGTWDCFFAGPRAQHTVFTGTAENLLEAACSPWLVSIYAIRRPGPRQLHSPDVIYEVPLLTDLNGSLHKQIKALVAPVSKVAIVPLPPGPRRVVARGYGHLSFHLHCHPIDARWVIAGMQDWGLSDGRHEIDIEVPGGARSEAPLCFFWNDGWGWKWRSPDAPQQQHKQGLHEDSDEDRGLEVRRHLRRVCVSRVQQC
jgi:hypothetical protein